MAITDNQYSVSTTTRTFFNQYEYVQYSYWVQIAYTAAVLAHCTSTSTVRVVIRVLAVLWDEYRTCTSTVRTSTVLVGDCHLQVLMAVLVYEYGTEYSIAIYTVTLLRLYVNSYIQVQYSVQVL